jgi:hypothetical protein
MNNMNKILQFGVWSILGLALIIIITFVYWLTSPYRILSFNTGNGTLVNKTVKNGEYLQMHQNSCKYMDIESNINRQYIDSIVYQVPPSTNNRPMGCSEKIEYVYVPKTLPAGNYYLNTVISFSVNPIRKIKYTVISDTFTIVK